MLRAPYLYAKWQSSDLTELLYNILFQYSTARKTFSRSSSHAVAEHSRSDQSRAATHERTHLMVRCLARSSALLMGVDMRSVVRNAARFAVYELIRISVKNHQAPPTMRPGNDLHRDAAHQQLQACLHLPRQKYGSKQERCRRGSGGGSGGGPLGRDGRALVHERRDDEPQAVADREIVLEHQHALVAARICTSVIRLARQYLTE